MLSRIVSRYTVRSVIARKPSQHFQLSRRGSVNGSPSLSFNHNFLECSKDRLYLVLRNFDSACSRMWETRLFKCPWYGAILVSAVVGNVGLFVAWQTLRRESMSRHFSLSWEGIHQKRFWTIWTSQFSHSSLEHLASNMSVFMVLGYSLQGILSLRCMVAHLFYTPLVSSGASLGSMYYLLGPDEAKALSRQYPDLDWNRFCYYRFLELKNGLLSALTPMFCRFKELGIPPETTVPPSGYDMPELVMRFEPYERWFYESRRGTMGMSAIVTSLEGFGAAWLLHLGVRGVWKSPIGMGLGFCLLLLQPVSDLATLVNPEARIGAGLFGALPKDGVGPRTDVVGHLAGFGNGVFLYLLRYQGLSKSLKQTFLCAVSIMGITGASMVSKLGGIEIDVSLPVDLLTLHVT